MCPLHIHSAINNDDLSGALPGEKVMVIQELTQMRQKFVKDIDGIIEKYGQS
ncbi:hypothetical protein FACS189450_14960 [Spirochaetia bacterium]|nr:hypothetical protein FACS189450_14960 [Spirochaetia bacterium]